MASADAPVQTILFLAANPKDTGRLQLDVEVRDIGEGLLRSQHRDQFILKPHLAVRPRDIQRAMLDVNPQIVHFSGHGQCEAGLIFEDDSGNAKLVEGSALTSLFKLFADQVRCVVLNGCSSDEQAKAIAQHIPYVIGMTGDIENKATTTFSVGFYDALGAGRDIEFAYKLGCNAIQMQGLDGHLTPILLKNPNSQPPNSQPPNNQPTPAETPPTASNSQPPATMPESNTSLAAPLEVFVSYSRDDEALKNKLCKHLSTLRRQNKITLWQDRTIEAGEASNDEIQAHLESADIFLLLVSSSFIDSDFCYSKEMKRAMERYDAKTARVIPIIMEPCDWKETPFSKLQALPKDAKAIATWPSQAEGLYDAATGIRKVVEALTKK